MELKDIKPGMRVWFTDTGFVDNEMVRTTGVGTVRKAERTNLILDQIVLDDITGLDGIPQEGTYKTWSLHCYASEKELKMALQQIEKEEAFNQRIEDMMSPLFDKLGGFMSNALNQSVNIVKRGSMSVLTRDQTTQDALLSYAGMKAQDAAFRFKNIMGEFVDKFVTCTEKSSLERMSEENKNLIFHTDLSHLKKEDDIILEDSDLNFGDSVDDIILTEEDLKFADLDAVFL